MWEFIFVSQSDNDGDEEEGDVVDSETDSMDEFVVVIIITKLFKIIAIILVKFSETLCLL